MADPALDLSEIIDLYKEDARQMVGTMQTCIKKWVEVQQGGEARQNLRRLSHQLRGSGRTYGFRNVTRVSKAIESLVQKLEKGKLSADDRLRVCIDKKIERLAVIFKV